MTASEAAAQARTIVRRPETRRIVADEKDGRCWIRVYHRSGGLQARYGSDTFERAIVLLKRAEHFDSRSTYFTWKISE